MNIVDSMISLLAPPVCVACGIEGRALCSFCSSVEITPFGERCWRCSALSPKARTCQSCRRTGSPRSIWVSTDYNGVAKELVQKYKFRHQRFAASSLADLMAETFWSLNSIAEITSTSYLVVPVPTASSRVRQRGFDHAALLAEHIAKKLNLPWSNVLGRFGQSRQVGTKRDERLKQAEGNYFARKPEIISGRNILLVDDVITTGATIYATSRILRQAGASHVDAIVFAKRM
jgi:ComF family protein